MLADRHSLLRVEGAETLVALPWKLLHQGMRVVKQDVAHVCRDRGNKGFSWRHESLVSLCCSPRVRGEREAACPIAKTRMQVSSLQASIVVLFNRCWKYSFLSQWHVLLQGALPPRFGGVLLRRECLTTVWLARNVVRSAAIGHKSNVCPTLGPPGLVVTREALMRNHIARRDRGQALHQARAEPAFLSSCCSPCVQGEQGARVLPATHHVATMRPVVATWCQSGQDAAICYHRTATWLMVTTG